MLLGVAAVALIVMAGLAFFSQQYTLDNIKLKTVGDGQHGTARWATKQEIRATYQHVPFRPQEWRRGEDLPTAQGLVLGCVGGRPVKQHSKLYSLLSRLDKRKKSRNQKSVILCGPSWTLTIFTV